MPSLKLPLWRAPEEHARGGCEDAAAPEFPASAEPPGNFTSRRSFVQLLGGGLALGATGCFNKPAEKIAPYTRRPVDLAPGNPLHYATSATLGGFATGLLVTAWEGRPTKVEGNPEHPSSLGAAGLFEQASLQSLYDPARAQQFKERGAATSRGRFFATMKALGDAHKKDGGARLRFLLEPSASPLALDIRQRVAAAFPNARMRAWSATPRDAIFAGSEAAFGQPFDVRPDLAHADVIAALDADFLSSGPGTLALMRQFSRRREGNAEMNRLYAAEAQLTTTGASADHRLRVRASDLPAVAIALAAQLQGLVPELKQLGALPATSLSKEAQRWVAALAIDLSRHPGRSAVLAGERQPAAVHALCHAINAALGNVGKTVVLHDNWLSDATVSWRSGPASLRELVAELERGEVDTLVITAWNPLYSAPADANLAAALGKAKEVVYLGEREDETSAKASWFVPAAHELEAWGDGRAHDGTLTFQQPLVAPLYGGVTSIEVLGALLGEGDVAPYERLRALYRARAGADFEGTWTKWISEGLIEGTAGKPQAAAVRWSAIGPLVTALPKPQPGLEVIFAADAKAHDGRFAGNAWLQELPEPISKLCWDNAALISPATAQRLNLEDGQLVDLSLRGKTLRVPVLVSPGQADDSLTLPLGYGRTAEADKVALNVGFNASAIRFSDLPWAASGVELTKVDQPLHKFALTHTHWTMEGRGLALDVKLTELREKKLPEELEEQRKDYPLMYDAYQYKGARWGMGIDLSKCTGCSACVVACQAENNIPVVGKEQVEKSREMAWLRIDRYYQGDLNDPQVISQPVACVHCEAAPCEYVCPVNATVHSDEGLNEMVYNRCVGTRYCSNNCPYKVRRFNFLRYNTEYSDVEKMRFNPDVTVRARGVMEKCTYCVQRIERVRIDSRVQGKSMKDGDIVTACQQACPAEAIVFGDLSDPNSKVSRLHGEERSYRLLNELNTKPRTWHLARVRNPNPELG